MEVKLCVLRSPTVRSFPCNLTTVCISAGRCLLVAAGFSASLQDLPAWIFVHSKLTREARVGLGFWVGGDAEMTFTSFVLMVARTERETDRQREKNILYLLSALPCVRIGTR